jgi:branched-chain amino acid transport system permease protein
MYVIGVLIITLPLYASNYFIRAVMTRALILGLVASSLVFLSKYAGMVSLAQTLMYGVAGFMVGNAVSDSGGRGLQLGWDAWVGLYFALGITVLVALIFGAIASRTTGIYFLMLTLTYAVIGFYFFGQVTTFSGFGGISGVTPPDVLDGPTRVYFAAAGISIVVYVAYRALARTPFGLALQGVRDDPVRMSSLGFNVPLHRTMAFVLAGLVAGLAGVLNIWWKGQIDPQSIAIARTIDILIIAVIGGISSLEGAWLGAFVFVLANNYLRVVPLIDEVGLTEDRFRTIVGLLVLVIVILSPEGLTGILQRGWAFIRSKVARTVREPPKPQAVDSG